MARYQLEPGPVPLHHQVYLDVTARLDDGEWPVGERLPTERELAALYGCSLITIRRALNELAREGRLERGRGRGTFVTERPIVRDIAGRLSFADEMRALGLHPFTRVETARQEPAPPVVAGALGLGVGTPTHFLERVRGADDVPLLLEQAWLPVARFPALLDVDFESHSLYEVLVSTYRCPIARTRELITAFTPTPREIRLLTLRGGRPAIQLEGTAFSRADEPVEYSRTVVSSERARYYLETSGGRARSVVPLDLPDGKLAAGVEQVAPSAAVAAAPVAGSG